MDLFVNKKSPYGAGLTLLASMSLAYPAVTSAFGLSVASLLLKLGAASQHCAIALS